jgi:hypothetical protein
LRPFVLLVKATCILNKDEDGEIGGMILIRKTQVLGENPLPIQLCQPKILFTETRWWNDTDKGEPSLKIQSEKKVKSKGVVIRESFIRGWRKNITFLQGSQASPPRRSVRSIMKMKMKMKMHKE